MCGAFQGPKDIPQSVIEAGSAAAEVGAFLSPARNTLVRDRKVSPEKNVWGERPRIGVFVCHCGINIGSVVDVPAVRDYAKTLAGSGLRCRQPLHLQSGHSTADSRDAVKEHQLNRVVVAACTPRTHEPLFQETIKEAGLNRYLFEMANIRDQDSWVHQ